MPSPNMIDEQRAEHSGRRILGGQPLFEPFEWGYRCPQGHRGELITWSEFNNHIWCHKCQLDYPSETCPMQRPSWMDPDEFGAFVSRLLFKPKILLGVDRSNKRVRRVAKIKNPPDCQSCHSFIRVDGRPACTHTPQKEGKPPYKFLKSLNPCEDLWRTR